jgi:hypothetical protein
MERLKRNPAVWGLMLGAAVMMVSTFLAWFKIEQPAKGTSATVRAFNVVSGQTIFLVALLVIIFAVFVLVSSGGGRKAWAAVELLLSLVLLVIGALGIFNTDFVAAQFATTQTMSTMAFTSTMQNANDAVKSGLDSGALTASFGFGLIVFIVGALIAVAGALYSFRTPPARD